MGTQQQVAPKPGEPIPVPPDFPVRWREAGWQYLFWQRDRMLFPNPLLPLEIDLFVDRIAGRAFSHAAETYSLPVTLVAQTQNGYYYQAAMPRGCSPQEMEALSHAAQDALERAGSTQIERWNRETLPRVQEHLATWTAMDLAGSSMERLCAFLDESVERLQDIWQLHFLTVLPSLPAVSIFEEMCRDLFADAPDVNPYRMLQGIPTRITEMGLELWALSRRAMAVAGVRRVLEEETAQDAVPALEETAEGRAFLADLRHYLNQYGQSGNLAIALAEVSWIEDPTPVITILKDYSGQPGRDLWAEGEALVAEREGAIAEARKNLAGFPQQVREQFEYRLDAAQQGLYIAEEHNFHIDYASTYRMRLVVLEVGRRLVATGALARSDDVFYLVIDEMRRALDASGAMNLQDTVARRRAQHIQHQAMQPPPVLGTMPSGSPPTDPLTVAATKFFGGPPRISPDPNTIQGNPGSPGVVRGPARVLRSVREVDRLRRGDILVAEMTAIPWTPLFAAATAIVTDTGGPLSHSAVTAREYGIPAVVGTATGTGVIRDGQMLEVDGFSGLVRILDNP